MSEFVIDNSINVSKWNQIITFLVSKIKKAWKWAIKGDFENPKVINLDFSSKSIPEQYGMLNSKVSWGGAKTLISGDSLYSLKTAKSCISKMDLWVIELRFLHRKF